MKQSLGRKLCITIALALAVSCAFFIHVLASGGATTFKSFDLSAYPRLGSENAPVQVVQISDFKCKWCAETYHTLKQGRATYGDKYNVYFVHFPLDRDCNVNLKRTLHPGSCRGAYAAQCAHLQGKFWEYADILFERQDDFWDQETLLRYAQALELDLDEFRECMSAPSTIAFITENIEMGRSVPIRHTPTIFFNGVEVKNIPTGGLPLFIKELQKFLKTLPDNIPQPE